jgi:dolichyl-phosphate-mannose-protein mannosyltransferase
MSFFYVHFAVLSHSGRGDSFMSPAFQETLIGNEMLLNSQGEYVQLSNASLSEYSLELRYFDTVTIKHKDTKMFLHSHVERYPLKYEDSRISSQGARLVFCVDFPVY